MKVLLISPQPFFQWRGSPIRVGFNATALARMGHEVDLLTLPVGERRAIEGVRILRVWPLPGVSNVPIGPSFAKLLFDGMLLLTGAWLACRRRYDVIHGIEDAGFIGVLLAALTGSRLVFEKHSDPRSHRKGAVRNTILNLYAAVERWTLRHADAVIATGRGLADQARSAAPGKPVHHIFDIPSSLAEADPERTGAIRSRLQRDPADVLALYVGSFAVYQGVDLMFDAIPPAVKHHARLRFIIIGGTPEEIEARRRQLREQGAEDAVEFLGKIPPDDLPDYLAAAHILLSPRQAGVNTPLKILDYFKAGGAIVAVDSEANRLLLDRETAWMTEPTPASFAEGILRVAGDEDLRRKLAMNGTKRVAQTYNFNEFSRRLQACYEGLPS